MITRQAVEADVPEMCCLLNNIIEIGGTTAYEDKVHDTHFNAFFIKGSDRLSLYVCVEKTGDILGFQSLSINSELPANWADIATFARVEPKIKGVGTHLFEATRKFALESGITAINATIRSDNESGLAYYSKIGFIDYSVNKAVPLKDGTPVDRISKKYAVGR